MPDFLPAGAPVSQAIIAESDFMGTARRVLAAIDRVHGDGQLPVISAGLTAHLLSEHAEANYYYESLFGETLGIRVSGAAEMPELSFLHEVGHFLDHQGLKFDLFLDQSGITVTDLQVSMEQTIFASENNPVLKDWRDATMSTEAVAQLQAAMRRRSAIVPSLDGAKVAVDVDHEYIHYLLEPRELFARCYAQYIVSQSQDSVMQRQLGSLREEPLAKLYPLYWDDEDFLGVAEALDDIFLKRGWIA